MPLCIRTVVVTWLAGDANKYDHYRGILFSFEHLFLYSICAKLGLLSGSGLAQLNVHVMIEKIDL